MYNFKFLHFLFSFICVFFELIVFIKNLITTKVLSNFSGFDRENFYNARKIKVFNLV